MTNVKSTPRLMIQGLAERSITGATAAIEFMIPNGRRWTAGSFCGFTSGRSPPGDLPLGQIATRPCYAQKACLKTLGGKNDFSLCIHDITDVPGDIRPGNAGPAADLRL